MAGETAELPDRMAELICPVPPSVAPAETVIAETVEPFTNRVPPAAVVDPAWVLVALSRSVPESSFVKAIRAERPGRTILLDGGFTAQ